MPVYQRKRKRQEKMATFFFWMLTFVCAGYISWMINPYPVKRGIRWIENQTEQFLDCCTEQTLMQTFPAISCFFVSKSSNPIESVNADTPTNSIDVTADPFYTKYLSFSQPGDG